MGACFSILIPYCDSNNVDTPNVQKHVSCKCDRLKHSKSKNIEYYNTPAS